MKRYFVFMGMDYYPRGGMDDFVSYHDDLQEAVNEAKKIIPYKVDWSHVYDTQKHEVIARFLHKEGIPDFDENGWESRYPWEHEDNAWIKEITK